VALCQYGWSFAVLFASRHENNCCLQPTQMAVVRSHCYIRSNSRRSCAQQRRHNLRLQVGTHVVEQGRVCQPCSWIRCPPLITANIQPTMPCRGHIHTHIPSQYMHQQPNAAILGEFPMCGACTVHLQTKHTVVITDPNQAGARQSFIPSV
jgi:hypothetical protein